MQLFRLWKEHQARRSLRRLVRVAARLDQKSVSVSDAARRRLREALEAGVAARGGEGSAVAAAQELEAAIYQSEFASHAMPQALRSTLELFFYVGLALTIRAFLYEPFKIPTGSMKPTLLHGDHVFIKKFRYGARVPFTAKRIWEGDPPKRGEIVVFNFPIDPRQDYIKRVIGLPGDTVRVIDGTIEVNGKPLPQQAGGPITYLRTDERNLTGQPVVGDLVYEKVGHRWIRTIHGPDRHPFYNDWPRAYLLRGLAPGPVTFDREGSGLDCNTSHCAVEPGYVFMMGDNRDGSADSRVWGAVPMRYLRGSATKIWFSHDWTQPVIPAGALTIGKLRTDRLFSDVNDPAELPQKQ